MNAHTMPETAAASFALSDEQRMLRESALRMMQESDHALPDLNAAPTPFDAARWAEFAELGWLALLVPEADDGLGGSVAEAGLIAEEFGRALMPAPFATSAVLCTTIVAAAPESAARSELLGALAVGETRLALAFEAPEGAEARAGKADGWRLSGRKIMVLDGVGADGFLVTAVPEGAERPALFHLPADAPGLRLRRYRMLDGRTAVDLIMEGALCPGAPLIGAESAGEAVEAGLDAARLTLAAEALGLMERVIAETRDYIGQRKQFGCPLGAFQVLRHRMADMFVECQNARAMLFRGQSLICAPAPARAAAVSATMVSIARAGEMIGGQGIQLHGGMGMTEEFAVGHCYKRLRVIAMSLGDPHMHLQRFQRLNPEQAA